MNSAVLEMCKIATFRLLIFRDLCTTEPGLWPRPTNLPSGGNEIDCVRIPWCAQRTDRRTDMQKSDVISRAFTA